MHILQKKWENLQLRGEKSGTQIRAENARAYGGASAGNDHHSAKPIREETDVWITRFRPSTVVLDFSGVKFMDSSGIGLILDRYNKAAATGGKVIVERATSAR